MDLLGYIIDFSIGLAGFAGVVAAFSTRKIDMLELERWRILNLLLLATGPGILSFIALGLNELVDDDFLVWRVACLCTALYCFAISATTMRGRTALSEQHRAMINSPVYYYSSIAAISVNIIVQVLAALGIFASQSFGLFFFGILFVLLIGVYQFIRAVLQSMNTTGASS